MRLFQSESGSVLVEFAVCLPLLLLLVAGIMDYALMIQEGMLVNEAATGPSPAITAT
jgi:Flp pilus assembly protein TadG